MRWIGRPRFKRLLYGYTLVASLGIVVTATFLLLPSAALAKVRLDGPALITDVPPAEQQAAKYGCTVPTSRVTTEAEQDNLEAIPDKHNYFVAELRSGDSGTFLTQLLVPEGWALVLYRPVDGIGVSAEYLSAYTICETEVLRLLSNAASEKLSSWQENIVWVINLLLQLYLNIGLWLLWVAEIAASYALSASRFITHPFVTGGWPFVQGIANLGFIFALLFIAFATTLKLDNFSARRMLPRLLIGALLINFSLVIGGLIIDMSRILMQVLLRVIGGPGASFDTLGRDLLANSHLIKIVVDTTALKAGGSWWLSEEVGYSSWEAPLMLLQATIMVWAMAMGLLFVAVLLFFRYLILILLLVVSPFAYLALALPKGKELAMKWWDSFLKWVIYGPAALFMLALIVRLVPTSEEGFAVNLINMILIVMMLFATATFARGLSAMGASQAVQYASGASNRLRRVGVGAGKVATYPIVKPVQMAGGATKRLARNQANDFKSAATTGLKNKYNKHAPKGWQIAERNDKGDLKSGQSSFGKRWGERLDPKVREAQAGARRAQTAVADSRAKGTDLAANPDLLASKLRNLSIESFSEDEIRHVIESDKTSEKQKEQFLKNPEVAERLMKKDTKTMNKILLLPTTGPNPVQNDENKSLIKALEDGLAAYQRKENKSS